MWKYNKQNTKFERSSEIIKRIFLNKLKIKARQKMDKSLSIKEIALQFKWTEITICILINYQTFKASL